MGTHGRYMLESTKYEPRSLARSPSMFPRDGGTYKGKIGSGGCENINLFVDGCLLDVALTEADKKDDV